MILISQFPREITAYMKEVVPPVWKSLVDGLKIYPCLLSFSFSLFLSFFLFLTHILMKTILYMMMGSVEAHKIQMATQWTLTPNF